MNEDALEKLLRDDCTGETFTAALEAIEWLGPPLL
jgi:hypothetical protein